METQQPPKKTIDLKILLVSILIVLFFQWWCNRPTVHEPLSGVEKEDSLNRALESTARLYILNNMNDPDSYEGDKWSMLIKYNEEGQQYYQKWHEFRGKNSFNATVKAFRRFTFNSYGNIIKVEEE